MKSREMEGGQTEQTERRPPQDALPRGREPEQETGWDGMGCDQGKECEVSSLPAS